VSINFTLNGHQYTNDPAVVISDGVPPEYQFIGYNATLALASYAEDVTAVGGDSANDAAVSAAAAQASAASAINAPATAGTSTTSLTTAYVSHTLTVQAGKNFNKGQWVTLASAAAPSTIQMSGPILSYDGATGAIVADIKAVQTLGATAADWIVSLSAPGGAGLGYNQYTGSQFYAAGIFEGAADLAAGSTADLSTATTFIKTATAAWALAVTGIPAGAQGSFVLELTNGGAFSFTPPAGTKFAGGVAPTLTVAGVDILGFYKLDGGAWRMLVLGKDVK
jgi:hypothetical protein